MVVVDKVREEQRRIEKEAKEVAKTEKKPRKERKDSKANYKIPVTDAELRYIWKESEKQGIKPWEFVTSIFQKAMEDPDTEFLPPVPYKNTGRYVSIYTPLEMRDYIKSLKKEWVTHLIQVGHRILIHAIREGVKKDEAFYAKLDRERAGNYSGESWPIQEDRTKIF